MYVGNAQMLATKTQISLFIPAVWSGPSTSANRVRWILIIWWAGCEVWSDFFLCVCVCVHITSSHTSSHCCPHRPFHGISKIDTGTVNWLNILQNFSFMLSNICESLHSSCYQCKQWNTTIVYSIVCFPWNIYATDKIWTFTTPREAICMKCQSLFSGIK